MRPRRGKSALKRAQEFFRFGCAYRAHAHAFGDLCEVQHRPVQVELGFGLGACVFGADTLKLRIEHRIRSVVEDDCCDVDTIIQNLKKTQLEGAWKPLFEKQIPAKWNLEGLLWKNLESYRNFALGVIASNISKADAARLYQLAARQRIDNFEIVLKRRFEGFQLPTVIDFLIVEAALTSISDYPPDDQINLMLRGSEVLLRTLRHQLSDFSVLLGSQDTNEARSNPSRTSSKDWMLDAKRSVSFQNR
jgi:hypothetical protein